MKGSIVQVNVSQGGVPKLAVPVGTVGELGLFGDAQSHFGGRDRALCLYSMEVIEAIRAEGHSLGPGSAGENVTLAGLAWDGVVPGTRLQLGERVEVVVTGYASPCSTNARWFKDRDFRRMSQSLHAGSSRTYARVVTTGVIRPGDAVIVLD